jgi:hypothetical protein
MKAESLLRLDSDAISIGMTAPSPFVTVESDSLVLALSCDTSSGVTRLRAASSIDIGQPPRTLLTAQAARPRNATKRLADHAVAHSISTRSQDPAIEGSTLVDTSNSLTGIGYPIEVRLAS